MNIVKKKRYFPFGYHMANGQIEIVSKESTLVQNIFESYLTGASLQQLVTLAEQSKIKFREDAVCWNKNMIARMLDDERYWNSDDYPSIVSKETGSAVISMRKQRATAQSPIMFIQKKLICSSCGSGLYRTVQRSPRVRWDCKNCGKRIGTTDSDLLQAVTDKLLAICHAPQSVEQTSAPRNSLSMQAARLTNEINQALNQREVDPQRVLPLILECAAEKYKICRIKKSDHIAMKMAALFQEHRDDKKLDRDLFEQTVEQVVLRPDGTVQLRLMNGKVL